MDKTTLSDQLKTLFESLGNDPDIIHVDRDLDGNPNGGYHRVKPSSPVATFTDDPVALACAAHREWVAGSTGLTMTADRWKSFNMVKVTDDDRRKALDLRKYYQQRYTMQALISTLTEYQKKCAEFLSGTHYLTTEEIGLLYRLPYFYEEDLAIDQIVELTKTDDAKYMNRPYREDQTGADIVPLLKVLKSRKSGDIYQYWFRSENGYAVVQEVKMSDPLLKLVDSLFKQPKLHVNAYVKGERFPAPHKDRAYGKLSRLELI